MAFKETNEGQRVADDFEFSAWTPEKEQDAQEIAAATQLPPPPSEFLKFPLGTPMFIRIMPPIGPALWVDDIGHMFKQLDTDKFVKFACPNHMQGERCAACEMAVYYRKHSKYGSRESKIGSNFALKLQKVTLAVDLNSPGNGVCKLSVTPRQKKTGGLFEMCNALANTNIGYWLPDGVDAKAGLVLPLLKQKTGTQETDVGFNWCVPVSRMPAVSVADIGKFRYSLKANEQGRPIVDAKQVQAAGIRTVKEWVNDYYDLHSPPHIPTYAETKAYVDGTALPEQRTMQTEMNAARGPAPDLRKFEED